MCVEGDPANVALSPFVDRKPPFLLLPFLVSRISFLELAEVGGRQKVVASTPAAKRTVFRGEQEKFQWGRREGKGLAVAFKETKR